MLSRVIRLALVVVVSVLTIVSLSCEGAPDAPEYDNPIIPGDPSYVPPQTTILSGPVEGAVVDSHAVTFTWVGNQDGMTFSYRLNEVRWSYWATDTTTTFQYLDEGDYLFQVRGQYTSGVIEDTAASSGFTVDDIHGPALWLYPRYQDVDVGSEFSLEVMLEEVENVFAVKVVLGFDPTALQVSNIEVYEDSRSLLKANGGTVIPFSSYDNTAGSVTCAVATATGAPPGVSGTGAVARVTFSMTGPGETLISFRASSSFRDPDNQDISLNETVHGMVGVQ
ncbi:MAG: cohesin domain-containing protein [Candidatus Neomarinimicrobiota bacterium]